MDACVHTRKLDWYIFTFVSVLPPHKLILTPLVLVCLSADWAGALVLFNSFLFVFAFRLVSCLTIDCLASCFLGLFLVCWFSLGGVLGPAMCGLLASACSGCPFVSGVSWSFCFLFGFCLWCRGFLLAFCFCCCLFLGCFVLLCCWCSGLVPLGSLSPCFVPPCCPPPRLVLWCLLVQSVLCWSLPLGIWLYLRRLGCHACGMVCCDGLAPFSLPLCVLVCGLLPLCFGLLLCLLVVFLSGVFGLFFPFLFVLLLDWWAVLVASLLR